ncbi:MAG: hypothetical protein FJ291_07880 [Planctomycetes bacterium]|nr:hypothetical protein [Planctomycetota bacterium]
MKVLIVNPNRCRQPMPVVPLGACMAAEAAERAGHAVRLLDLMFSRNPARALEAELHRHPPDAVAVTAESAADATLAGLRKGYDAATVRRVAGVVARHRIPCMWIFLLGGPGETRATVRETLGFARTAVRPTDVAFFNFGLRIYPGAGIEAIARQEGLLSLPPADMLKPVFYFSPELDIEWLRAEFARAAASQPNLLGPTALRVPFLPAAYRILYRLGVRPPMWRFTRHARRLKRWRSRPGRAGRPSSGPAWRRPTSRPSWSTPARATSAQASRPTCSRNWASRATCGPTTSWGPAAAAPCPTSRCAATSSGARPTASPSASQWRFAPRRFRWGTT